MIDSERIHNLVEIFYQKPPFKTFYVNSLDGQEFVKPVAVFVSLGITTSVKVMTDLAEVLGRTPGISTKLVELRSTRIGQHYMNYVTNDVDPGQYQVDPGTVAPKRVIMGKENVILELDHITDPVEYMKLKEVYNRIESENSWDTQGVLCLGDGYRVFHSICNYKREGEHEYRLGIYVEETD